MKNYINLEKLIKYYQKGFFPMAENKYDKKVSFYKPLKRFIIPIDNFHIPKKLLNNFKKKNFKFKINKNFLKIIKLCQDAKRKSDGTWINEIIINTYNELHKINKCHSIECYEDEKLVGGLYGVHLGSCFFGESMFSLKDNTSKLSLLYLISILKKNNFKLLDSQFYNPHLLQFGAYEITNRKYMGILKEGLNISSEFKEIKSFQESLSIIQSINHKS